MHSSRQEQRVDSSRPPPRSPSDTWYLRPVAELRGPCQAGVVIWWPAPEIQPRLSNAHICSTTMTRPASDDSLLDIVWSCSHQATAVTAAPRCPPARSPASCAARPPPPPPPPPPMSYASASPAPRMSWHRCCPGSKAETCDILRCQAMCVHTPGTLIHCCMFPGWNDQSDASWH